MGYTFLAIGAVPIIGLPPKISVIISLFLIAIGAGGFRPYIVTFGADQFKIPEQAGLVTKYFSLIYLIFNIGPLLAATIIPILREDVHCFGENNCYSLAFGVPVILMTFSTRNIFLLSKDCHVEIILINFFFFNFLVILVIGKSSYTRNKPSSENMLLQIFKCIKVTKLLYYQNIIS